MDNNKMMAAARDVLAAVLPEGSPLLLAAPFMDADPGIRHAMLLLHRMLDVDRQVVEVVGGCVARFFLLYVRMLTADAAPAPEDVRTLLELRSSAFDAATELQLKAFALPRGETTYAAGLAGLRASLSTCLAALWHKHRAPDAVEGYHPRPFDPAWREPR